LLTVIIAHCANVHSTLNVEKIEVEVLYEIILSDSNVDPFDKVMGFATYRRVQLYGRGVLLKNLKEKGLGEKRMESWLLCYKNMLIL